MKINDQLAADKQDKINQASTAWLHWDLRGNLAGISIKRGGLAGLDAAMRADRYTKRSIGT